MTRGMRHLAGFAGTDLSGIGRRPRPRAAYGPCSLAGGLGRQGGVGPAWSPTATAAFLGARSGTPEFQRRSQASARLGFGRLSHVSAESYYDLIIGTWPRPARQFQTPRFCHVALEEVAMRVRSWPWFVLSISVSLLTSSFPAGGLHAALLESAAIKSAAVVSLDGPAWLLAPIRRTSDVIKSGGRNPLGRPSPRGCRASSRRHFPCIMARPGIGAS